MDGILLNVTEDQLRSYIESFHRTLDSSATQFLPPQYRDGLLHRSLLPARITGFVSTQLGVGIEYEPSTETQIEIIRGSARVEDLFVRAPAHIRDSGPMFSIDARNTFFAKLTLSGAFPFRLSAPDASVSFQDVAFEIGPWQRDVVFAEIFSDRNVEGWSLGMAESRAKDEVLAAMVQLRRAEQRSISLGEYIPRFKNKSVLLLGDYEDDGRERLRAIAAALAMHGYDPILVEDVPDHPHQDLPQKVVLLGALARFIVVDDSSKSGHLLEIQLCKNNNWVTVLLRAEGKGGSWMTAGSAYTSNVIRELAYDPHSPGEALNEAIAWAEAKLHELERKFDNTYPWRTDSY